MTGKIAIFIDGANFGATARALGFQVDFARLLLEFERRGSILRAFFYFNWAAEGGLSGMRLLADWLDYNRFTVRRKPAKEFDDGEGRRKISRNIAVELTIDALEL